MKRLTCLPACFFLTIAATAQAELRPANIFNDHYRDAIDRWNSESPRQ